MKIFFALWLLSAVSPAFASSGGGFVGNGGQGVQFADKVFVRDLWEAGLTGSEPARVAVDPYFTRAGKNLSFDFPRDLLARTLSDANLKYPGLGDYLAATISTYEWSLTDFELVEVSESGPERLPPGARYVQLANRLGTKIRIHRSLWSQLDDSNKVGLIIHEALFSLVIPIAGVDGLFVQTDRTAREATAWLFSEARSTPPLERLGIPRRSFDVELLRRKPIWTLRVSSKHFVLENFAEDSLRAFVKDICALVDRERAAGRPVEIDGTRIVNPVFRRIKSYRVGSVEKQKYVEFSPAADGGIVRQTIESEITQFQCESLLLDNALIDADLQVWP